MFTRNIVQTKEFWVPGLSSALLQEPEDKSRRDWSHWKGSALVPQFSLWNDEFHETRECCIGLEGKTKNRFSNIIRFSFQWEDFVLLPTFHFLPCLSLPSREGIAFQPKPSTTLVFKVSLLIRWEKKKSAIFWMLPCSYHTLSCCYHPSFWTFSMFWNDYPTLWISPGFGLIWYKIRRAEKLLKRWWVLEAF